MNVLVELLKELLPSVVSFILKEIEDNSSDEQILEKLKVIANNSEQNLTKLQLIIAKARMLKELE